MQNPNESKTRTGSGQIRICHAVAICVLVLCTLSYTGCSRTAPARNLSEPEKQARISELATEYHAQFPRAKDIDVEEYLKMRANGDPVLVDVREPNEQAVSMIPGAITREEFEQHKSEYGRRTVVAYCTIGYRSGEYCQLLLGEGIDAFNLRGSILAWVQAGQPVIDSTGKETHRVHTYGRQWALLPDGYEAVY